MGNEPWSGEDKEPVKELSVSFLVLFPLLLLLLSGMVKQATTRAPWLKKYCRVVSIVVV